MPPLPGSPTRGLLDDLARLEGNRSAFVEGSTGRTVSWRAIADTVAGWQSAGAVLGPGARVGLLAADPLEMLTAYLAALAAGVMVAPLDPGAPPSEIAVQCRRLGVSAVVTDAEAEWRSQDEVPGLQTTTLRWWTTGSAGPVVGPPPAGRRAPTGNAAVECEDGHPALLLASSGTTGEPKIIPLSAAQLLATARAVSRSHGLGADDIGYSPLPLWHINGLVVGVLSTLVTGGCLVVDRRFSASRFWATIARHRVTWLNLVPAIISVLADRPGPPAGLAKRVAFARSASAPLPATTRRRFEGNCGVGVLETYGMTEAASQITANPRDARSRRPGSVGRAVDVDLRIVDRHGDRVVTGDVGQVQIRGPRVVARYWSPLTKLSSAVGAGPGVARVARPLSRPATPPDGWLSTGDLGWVDEDGFVYLVGRVDDVINRGGEKVFPREVEDVLLSDPGVAAAAVVGRPHPVNGEEPVAFVLAAPPPDRAGADGGAGAEAGAGALAERLAARCCEELSRAKRPAEIVVVDSLPLGPTGKVRRAGLLAAIGSAGEVVRPETPGE